MVPLLGAAEHCVSGLSVDSLIITSGCLRAKPIDLSAGNEPFHINGGRGEFVFVRGRDIGCRNAHGFPHKKRMTNMVIVKYIFYEFGEFI